MLNPEQFRELAQHCVAQERQLTLSREHAREARLTVLYPALGGEGDLALLDLSCHFVERDR
jgi:hypothetical protein